MIVYEAHYRVPGHIEMRVSLYTADAETAVQAALEANGMRVLAVLPHEVEHLVDPNLRYPADRPGWLGPGQPWPCGRCGQKVDAEDPHHCVPSELP